MDTDRLYAAAQRSTQSSPDARQRTGPARKLSARSAGYSAVQMLSCFNG